VKKGEGPITHHLLCTTGFLARERESSNPHVGKIPKEKGEKRRIVSGKRETKEALTSSKESVLLPAQKKAVVLR